MRKIALVKFTENDGDTTYEYLLPEGTADDITHVVVKTSERQTTGSTGMKVVKCRGIKELVDQDYSGDLKPVVAAFNIATYEAEVSRQKRKANLARLINAKLEDMGLIAKVKALGLDDNPEMTKLINEFKNL